VIGRGGCEVISAFDMRPPSPSIPEKEFLQSALSQSLRLDGRLPLESRTVSLEFGPELGYVECSLGKTKYVDAVL
jgi:exosome complex component RRP45